MLTGREFDSETGLYYYRARYYSPQLRRFIEPDPIGFEGGMNLYTYVSNDPANAVDPWGLLKVTGVGNEPIYVHPNDVDPFPSQPHGHVGAPNSRTKVDVNTGEIYQGNENTGKKLPKKHLELLRHILRGKQLLQLQPIFLFEWQLQLLDYPGYKFIDRESYNTPCGKPVS